MATLKLKVFDGIILDYNSYISVEELKEIVSENIFCNYDNIDTEDDLLLEKYLINISELFDNNFNFVGIKYNIDQNLEFPRNFEKFEINKSIKTAISYIVCMFKNGTIDEFLNKTYETQVQTEKVDVLQTSYFENKNLEKSIFVKHPYLKNLIYDYISDYNMFATIKRV